jgi:hypothetical protein
MSIHGIFSQKRSRIRQNYVLQTPLDVITGGLAAKAGAFFSRLLFQPAPKHRLQTIEVSSARMSNFVAAVHIKRGPLIRCSEWLVMLTFEFNANGECSFL